MSLLVLLISQEQPLSMQREQPFWIQNKKLEKGITALVKHDKAIAVPTIPYHSGLKSANSPCSTGLCEGTSKISLNLELSSSLKFISSRMRAVLTNMTIHIFLPEAARRYVLVCLPSMAANSRRRTRKVALSPAMKSVRASIARVTTWNCVSQSLHNNSPPSNSI